MKVILILYLLDQAVNAQFREMGRDLVIFKELSIALDE